MSDAAITVDPPVKPVAVDPPVKPVTDRSRKAPVIDRSPRTEAEVSRLLEAAVADGQRTEGDCLSALLRHKLAHFTPGDNDELVADTLGLRMAYLRYRFATRLAAHERSSHFYAHLDTVLNLVSIAAGIGASLIAALAAPKGWAILFGIIVAACQTFSQWLKPAQRATRRGRSAAELRNEAWSFLQSRDRYKDKDIETAWAIFCGQVEKVENREETDEEADLLSGPASSKGK